MKAFHIARLIRNHVFSLLIAGIIVGGPATLFYMSNAQGFKVRTDFLVAQTAAGRDLYSLSKSAEYAGNVLSDALFSNLFIDEVIKTKRLDPGIFPTNLKDRLEDWDKSITVRKNLQSSMLSVQVLRDDGLEALNMSKAISEVLTQNNELFRAGGKDDVTIRVLSGPVVEKSPDMLSIIFVAGGSGGAGILLALAYFIAKAEYSAVVRGSKEAVIVQARA